MADQQPNPQPTPTPTNEGHVGSASGSWDDNGPSIEPLAPNQYDFSHISGHIAHLPLDPLGEIGQAADALSRSVSRATSMTQEGRAAHPHLAQVADLARNINEFISGGKAVGKPEGTKHGVGGTAANAALMMSPEATAEGVKLLGPEAGLASATEKVGELGAAIRTGEMAKVKEVLKSWLPDSQAEHEAERLIESAPAEHETEPQLQIAKRFDFDHIEGHKEEPPEGQYEQTVGTVSPRDFIHNINPGGTIDQATVDAYRQRIRNGEDVGPVQKFVDEDGNLIFGNGRHRALAHLMEGTPRIAYELHQRVPAAAEEEAEINIPASHINIPEFYGGRQIGIKGATDGSGTDPVQTIHHEMGHFVVGKKLGFLFNDGIRSHAHPKVTGAAAVALGNLREQPWFPRMLRGSNLLINRGEESRTAFATKYAPMLAGGGVADELLHDIPFEINRGMVGDRAEFQDLAKQLGFTDAERDEIWANSRMIAHDILTKGDTLKTMQKYSAEREEGLLRRWHMSGDRLHDMWDEISGTTNPRPEFERNDYFRKPRAPKTPTGEEYLSRESQPVVPGVRTGLSEGIPANVAGRPSEGAPGDVTGEPQAGGESEPINVPKTISAGAEEQLDQQEKERGLVSTALPYGKNAIADPLQQQTHIGMNSISDAVAQKFTKIIRAMPDVKIPKGMTDPQKIMRVAVDHFKDNLRALWNDVEPSVREQTKKWYTSANKLAGGLGQQYNLTMPQASGLIAVLSPQKDWDQNYDLARRVISIQSSQQEAQTDAAMQAKLHELVAKTTKEDQKGNENLALRINEGLGKQFKDMDIHQKAAFTRLYDETYNTDRSFQKLDPGTGNLVGKVLTDYGDPRSVAWGGLNSIEKAISIIENGSVENIHNMLGEQHKVRNFYNNILDPTNPRHVTIDTHAVAASHYRIMGQKTMEVNQNFSGPGDAAQGLSGTYPLYTTAYRELANELGVLPRELQSVVWEHIREMFPDEFKRVKETVGGDQHLKHVGAVDNIWAAYKRGDINRDKARQLVSQYTEKNLTGLMEAKAEKVGKHLAKTMGAYATPEGRGELQ